MSFWDLSDGGSANEDAQKEYEVPGGNMDPIPNNSDCLAHIKAAKWASKRDANERYIEIQWQVEKPEEYLNRVVFQKLWVDDLDPMAKSQDKAKEKRDKARRMLATIDANAKGKLMQSGEAPTDDSLALALVDARMVVKVMLWEMNDSQNYGEKIRGNWVSAIKPKDAETKTGDPLPSKSSGSSGAGGGGRPSSGGGGFDLDDEIPFAPEVRV
jgi:hypothetical protein